MHALHMLLLRALRWLRAAMRRALVGIQRGVGRGAAEPATLRSSGAAPAARTAVAQPKSKKVKALRHAALTRNTNSS